MSFDSEKNSSIACTNKSYRSLKNCVGVWEVNSKIINEADGRPEILGVCETHFHIDQNSKMHSPGIKQLKPIDLAVIICKRCLFCYKDFKVYSRCKSCHEHAWKIIGKNILTSCVCQYKCPSLTNDVSLSEKIGIVNPSSRPRYICQECYQKNGGHVYVPPGKGNKVSTCQEKNLLKEKEGE